MDIQASLVKELREKTGCGLMDCKRALTETSGDLEQAIDYLRKKGLSSADKKSSRATSEGLVYSYIHSNSRIGVLLELNCETDFVARNEIFHQLAKDICMHIAASGPVYVKKDDVSPDFIAREKAIFIDQARQLGKPEAMLEKIVEGKLNKRIEEICLLNQAFVKNPDLTIENLVKEHIAKIGENIVVNRFARFQIGEA